MPEKHRSRRFLLRKFEIPGVRNGHITSMQPWVTTGDDYFFSPSFDALHQLHEGDPELSSGAEVVPIEKGALTVSNPKGTGVCRVQIDVIIRDLNPLLSFPWRIWIKEREVWRSNKYNELVSDASGIATGIATVNVINLLPALNQDMKVHEILELLMNHENPDAALGSYPDWELEVVMPGRRRSDLWREEEPDHRWEREPGPNKYEIDMGVPYPRS